MEYQYIYNKLDEFATLSLSQAVPIATGQQGSLYARGAGDFIRAMFQTAATAYNSMIGLADADARIRAAAMNADATIFSAQASMYNARLGYAGRSDMAAATVAAAAARANAATTAAALQYQASQNSLAESQRQFDAQLGLQTDALNYVSSIHDQAQSIQSLAYSLANIDYDSTLHSYSNEGGSND